MKILRSKGEKAVKIEQDKYGINLCATRNGYQWSCIGVDDELELLEMIKEVIDEFNEKDKPDAR